MFTLLFMLVSLGVAGVLAHKLGYEDGTKSGIITAIEDTGGDGR